MASINTKLFQDFITLFLGLVVEAFPFVVLGVMVSVIVGIFFKEEWIFKILPKNRILSHFMLSTLGIFMPVCECGNVPVVRRLLQKGFDVSHSITFLLAAPIVNPVTFISTWSAFSDDHEVAFIRVLAAILISNGIGILLSFKKNQNEFLNQKFYKEICESHEHHDHKTSKLKDATNIFQKEFIEVFRMLIIGAVLASLSQVLIPRDVITSIGSNLVLSVIAMMVLAFVISICANVDAFFALSYSNTFTIGSLLSFLTFGPMIDIKILSMLKTTFTTKLLIYMTLFVALGSMIVGLSVNYLL